MTHAIENRLEIPQKKKAKKENKPMQGEKNDKEIATEAKWALEGKMIKDRIKSSCIKEKAKSQVE